MAHVIYINWHPQKLTDSRKKKKKTAKKHFLYKHSTTFLCHMNESLLSLFMDLFLTASFQAINTK